MSNYCGYCNKPLSSVSHTCRRVHPGVTSTKPAESDPPWPPTTTDMRLCRDAIHDFNLDGRFSKVPINYLAFAVKEYDAIVARNKWLEDRFDHVFIGKLEKERDQLETENASLREEISALREAINIWTDKSPRTNREMLSMANIIRDKRDGK